MNVSYAKNTLKEESSSQLALNYYYELCHRAKNTEIVAFLFQICVGHWLIP